MLTFNVEKTFEKDMLPVLPAGSTYPYTFGTAIPFEINIHFSARQISDGKIYQIDVLLDTIKFVAIVRTASTIAGIKVGML